MSCNFFLKGNVNFTTCENFSHKIICNVKIVEANDHQRAGETKSRKMVKFEDQVNDNVVMSLLLRITHKI